MAPLLPCPQGVHHDDQDSAAIRRSYDRIRLIGRIQSEHLDELRAQMADCGSEVVWDLTEVMLVDVDVVRFFNDCESRNNTLLHCPGYIREWMARESPDTHR